MSSQDKLPESMRDPLPDNVTEVFNDGQQAYYKVKMDFSNTFTETTVPLDDPDFLNFIENRENNLIPNTITFRTNEPPAEIIRIAGDGRIYWREREVETDQDFRNAMLDLRDCLCRSIQ